MIYSSQKCRAFLDLPDFYGWVANKAASQGKKRPSKECYHTILLSEPVVEFKEVFIPHAEVGYLWQSYQQQLLYPQLVPQVDPEDVLGWRVIKNNSDTSGAAVLISYLTKVGDLSPKEIRASLRAAGVKKIFCRLAIPPQEVLTTASDSAQQTKDDSSARSPLGKAAHQKKNGVAIDAKKMRAEFMRKAISNLNESWVEACSYNQSLPWLQVSPWFIAQLQRSFFLTLLWVTASASIYASAKVRSESPDPSQYEAMRIDFRESNGAVEVVQGELEHQRAYAERVQLQGEQYDRLFALLNTLSGLAQIERVYISEEGVRAQAHFFDQSVLELLQESAQIEHIKRDDITYEFSVKFALIEPVGSDDEVIE